MKTKLFITALLFGLSTLSFATDDLLDQRELSIKSQRYSDVIALTTQNLKDVLDGYQMVMGPGFSVVKPLVISGTQANPNLKATLRKCFAFVCKVVELEADLTIDYVNGTCDENLLLKADLQKSGELLTDVYDDFYITICAKRTAEGAKLMLNSYATRAPTYNGGIIASTIKDFLQLQMPAIMASLQTEINQNIRIIDGKKVASTF